ncbi:gpi anchored serine-rich protein [Diaporthe eres]|nr:gpi anchored serine-rich protein [Diaporthe eres]
MKSAVFAGLLATAVATEVQSTVYATEQITITSCAPTVTDCPARSTEVSSKVHSFTQSTVYSTAYETITSCAPEVTNCPAESTVVSSSSYSVSTTLAPIPETSVTPTPSGPAGTPPAGTPSAGTPPAGTGVPPVASSGPAPGPSGPAGVPSWVSSSSPVTTGAPGGGAGGVCPTYSVKTISTTTVVPTVIYETVAVPCGPTGVPPAPSTGFGVPPPAGGNGTVTGSVPTPTAVVTAGAGRTFGVSAALAGVAGLVAFLA